METLNGIVYVIAAAFICAVSLAFGWLCIIVTAVSPNYSIMWGSGVGLIEMTAAAGLYSYTALWVAYVGFGFFYKDKPDEMPAVFEFLGGFLRFKHIEETVAKVNADVPIDLGELAEEAKQRRDMNTKYEPNFVTQARTRQQQETAEQINAKTAALEAEAAMQEATRKYNQAKAKADALRRGK